MVDDKEFLDRIDKFQSQSISFIFSNSEPTKRKIPAHIKEKVKSAAGEQCPICKTTMISSPSPKQTPLDARESTPDHIVDLDLGGKNTEENFLIICHKCNWAKNHAKQRYLNTPGIHGGTPGHPAWRAAFRSKGSNIAKLLEYVEWSFRIEDPSSEHRFPELHGYFMQDRFDKSEEPKPTSRKRLEKPEDTLWRRLIRFFGRIFRSKPEKPQMKPEKPRTNLLTEPSELPKLDFTPEDFVTGLLRNKTREGQMAFNFLYGRLIEENPKFKLQNYGIKPSSYLQEECSSLLSIEKRMHKNGITSTLWIEEDRKCSFCNELGHHIDDCERLAKRKASLEDESRKADREAEILLAGLGKVEEDKKKATQKEGISEFKLIIEGIIRDSEQKKADGRHIITISALGQRFSKRVQATGFGNKKEYFQKKGLDPSMSISKAIHAYFSEEEIEFVGERIWTGSHFKTNHTHVVLNRRG